MKKPRVLSGNILHWSPFKSREKTDQDFASGRVKRAAIEDISHHDVIVLVLGQPGSGKSMVVGCNVGVKLPSGPGTKDVAPIRLELLKPDQPHEGDLILVDTPGIGVERKSKNREKISKWCREARNHGLVISGVLYFQTFQTAPHPISFAAFSSLVGEEHNREKIFSILSRRNPVAGQQAIKENPSLQVDVTTREFSGTVESAFNIIRGITSESFISRIPPKDIVIAVMGPTGSGKSTFISKLTTQDVKIGDDLESCTQFVQQYTVSGPTPSDGDRVFVDTPGFNDTNSSELDILKRISDWLNLSYGQGVKLSGLLYLHPIIEPRMSGSMLNNLRMFQELCGQAMFQNVILVTTMWDVLVGGEAMEATNRETELKTEYWRQMIALGSRTARFDQKTPHSAPQIIDTLIEASTSSASHTLRPTITLLQQEMNELRLKLPETAAGRQLFSHLEVNVSKYRDTVDQITKKIEECKAEGDKEALVDLINQLEETRQKLSSAMKDMDQLSLDKGPWETVSRLMHRMYPISEKNTPMQKKDKEDDSSLWKGH